MIQKPENLGDVMVVATKGLGVEVATAHAIAAHVTGKGRAWVIAHPEAQLDTEQVRTICNMLTWVRLGKPLAHLLGKREFYGLDFAVTKDVLVPRPETELLVDLVHEWAATQSSDEALSILDVGTGSGAVAVTLSHLLPQAQVMGVDVSTEALTVAAQNAETHDVGHRVWFRRSNLLASVEGHFNVIAANLPYVATDVLAQLPVRRFEPRLALDGGPTGLSLIERLLQQAPAHLTTPGLIALEIGYDQGEAVKALARKAFPQGVVTLHQDFAELDRVITVATGCPPS
jgi:release factor glutamine methyltransferase